MGALGLFLIEAFIAVLESVFQILHGLFRLVKWLRRKKRGEPEVAPPPLPPNKIVFRLGYTAARLFGVRRRIIR